MPDGIEPGQVWRNVQSKKDWTVLRIERPWPRERKLLGPWLVVVGAAGSRYEVSNRIGWFLKRYRLVAANLVGGSR